jgi:hypothetical protein
MKYRKKPVVIEAIQWKGRLDAFLPWALPLPFDLSRTPDIYIKTLEGEMRCQVGDWIIKGVKGEFYSCKPDIFALTYEEAPDEKADS